MAKRHELNAVQLYSELIAKPQSIARLNDGGFDFIRNALGHDKAMELIRKNPLLLQNLDNKAITKETVNRIYQLILSDISYAKHLSDKMWSALVDKLSVDQISELVERDENILDGCSEDTIVKIREKMSVYTGTFTGDADNPYMLFSLVNLREEDIRNFHMITLISFLYRMNIEYKDTIRKRLEEAKLDEINRANNAGIEDRAKWKYAVLTPEQAKALDDEAALRVKHVRDFLNYYLKFNPDRHVRSSFVPNPKDPTRGTFKEGTILPSVDVFHEWRHYTQANYDALRALTQAIFPMKPGIEYTVQPYGIVKNEAEFRDFKLKYRKQLKADVYMAKLWHWTFMGDWSANRQKVDFYDEKNEIMKTIIDTIESDRIVAADIMKKRVTSQHKRNEITDGPHTYGLNECLEAHPPKIAETAERVVDTSTPDKAIAAELPDLSDLSEECPSNAVEVNVIRIENKIDDPEDEGKSEITIQKFFTESEKLEPDQIVVKNAQQAQKDAIEAEKKARKARKKIKKVVGETSK